MNKSLIDSQDVRRIHTLDLLRGYFLIVILLDHLAYFPSGLDALTGRGLLYVSSAEGFFLISGIVLGIVRGRKLIAQPFLAAAKKLWKRSLQLYLTSAVLTIMFTIIGWVFFMHSPGLKYGILDPATPLLNVLWQTLTFQYTYGWADFLRYYAVFIALTPLALWLLRKGYWWLALAGSIAIWWTYRLTPGGELYAPLSWQLVFVSGFIIGFHWPHIRNFWHRVQPVMQTVIRRTLLVAFLVTAVISALLVFGDMQHVPLLSEWHRQIVPYFNKDEMPMPRIILGSVWFWALFLMVRRHEAWCTRRIGGLLLPLGENSLYVYTIEAFVIFLFHIFVVMPQPIFQLAPWYVNLSLSLIAIAIVWVVTKRGLFARIIPR